MSTTVTYKGNTITTVDNETKVLATGGKYLEGNISLVDTPSGSVVKEAKDVNFIDYDGTIIESYTTAEWANVSSLPANPSHTDLGLIAQGWNWTKSQIDTQLTSVGGEVWVGQMYATASGDTEIDIVIDNDFRLDPTLTIYVDGSVTVDWGDDSTPSTQSGSGTNYDIRHTYSAAGSYTIKIHSTSGSYKLASSYQKPLLSKGQTSITANSMYGNYVKFIRVASGVECGDYPFQYLMELEKITLPSGMLNLGASAFAYSNKLKCVVIPNSITTIGSTCFFNASSLEQLSLPPSITTISSGSFRMLVGLKSLTIPYGVTSIGSNIFYEYAKIRKLYVPSTVPSSNTVLCYGIHTLEEVVYNGGVMQITNAYSVKKITIKNGCTAIPTNAFNNCTRLTEITIPATVTSMGDKAFAACVSIKEIHFLSTTPPTFETTTVFPSTMSSDYLIYVPSASLNDYKTATNITTSIANKMIGE